MAACSGAFDSVFFFFPQRTSAKISPQWLWGQHGWELLQVLGKEQKIKHLTRNFGGRSRDMIRRADSEDDTFIKCVSEAITGHIFWYLINSSAIYQSKLPNTHHFFPQNKTSGGVSVESGVLKSAYLTIFWYLSTSTLNWCDYGRAVRPQTEL